MKGPVARSRRDEEGSDVIVANWSRSFCFPMRSPHSMPFSERLDFSLSARVYSRVLLLVVYEAAKCCKVSGSYANGNRVTPSCRLARRQRRRS